MTISRRTIALAVGVLIIIAVFDVSAQWTPGKTVVYMGDLNLMSSSVSGESMPREVGGSSQMSSPAGNSSAITSPMNNSTMNNSSANSTAMNNSSINTSAMNNPSMNRPPTVPMIDLNRYSRDRRDKNLAGYKNIMYPLAESRGSTTSTAGAGGGGGGCGSC